jgi:hypothetical protein
MLADELRQEVFARRTASTGWRPYRYHGPSSMRWEPLRPLIIGERSYRYLEALAARLLHLAVEACRRRASTAGELYELLRFPHKLPLLDPDRLLVAAELTRYARPDLLIEQGRPQFLEMNNSNRLGGVGNSTRLAESYARLWPTSGLHPPPSAVTARLRRWPEHIDPLARTDRDERSSPRTGRPATTARSGTTG